MCLGIEFQMEGLATENTHKTLSSSLFVLIMIICGIGFWFQDYRCRQIIRTVLFEGCFGDVDDMDIKPLGVSIIASEVWGAMRGMETFSQLVYEDDSGRVCFVSQCSHS